MGNHFLFLVYISLLEIAENLDLADKSLVTDFYAKSSVHCTSNFIKALAMAICKVEVIK